eukprot:m.271047 g.271047  ORF g.271047 m.271047 type:complete len:218 (+) comp16266_c0_seq27:190-843(+)
MSTPFVYRPALKLNGVRDRLEEPQLNFRDIASSLEPVPELLKELCHRITPNIIIGKSPNKWEDEELSSLIQECGVDVFVNLQEPKFLNKYDYYNRYAKLSDKDGRDVQFIHCPIDNFGVLDDSDFHLLLDELVGLAPSHTIYIHCFGGHGRSGLISSALLQKIYGVSFKDSMTHLKTAHTPRQCQKRCALSRGELESAKQTSQAKRIVKRNLPASKK